LVRANNAVRLFIERLLVSEKEVRDQRDKMRRLMKSFLPEKAFAPSKSQFDQAASGLQNS
jgi:hypothetical protein